MYVRVQQSGTARYVYLSWRRFMLRSYGALNEICFGTLNPVGSELSELTSDGRLFIVPELSSGCLYALSVQQHIAIVACTGKLHVVNRRRHQSTRRRQVSFRFDRYRWRFFLSARGQIFPRTNALFSLSCHDSLKMRHSLANVLIPVKYKRYWLIRDYTSHAIRWEKPLPLFKGGTPKVHRKSGTCWK